jgi:hypothetical protein
VTSKQLEEKVANLESDRNKLIKDNIALIRQIEHFKQEIDKTYAALQRQQEIQ